MSLNFKLLLSILMSILLWGCNSADNIIDYTEDLVVVDPESGSTADFNENRNVYFGDLRVHTKH